VVVVGGGMLEAGVVEPTAPSLLPSLEELDEVLPESESLVEPNEVLPESEEVESLLLSLQFGL